VARTRTTKKLAQRIDLNYFKRPTPLKRAKFWLSVAATAMALIWISWHGLARDSRVYSSGRMSEAHAVLEAECAACHEAEPAKFSAKPNRFGCLSCHDAPMHHTTLEKSPDCASCHTEHRGRTNLSAAKDQACASCHSDLRRTYGGYFRYTNRILSLAEGHPEFAAVREGQRDPGTIHLNHAIHMKPIRMSPNGPLVQLECRDCHRTAADKAGWAHGDDRYIAAESNYRSENEFLPAKDESLTPRAAMSGRELMAPVKFATACSGCHSLAFDKRFNEGVPHDKPEVVHAFLVKKFSEHIAAHPGELREARDPGRDLSGRPVQAAVRVYAPNEWVGARIKDAEELLWRKTCKQCHALTVVAGQNTLPVVEPARTTVKWMPHARFDHDAHRGFSCASCHEKALSSTETSEVLLPGIATCRTCHAPGPDHTESRCFECHTYHDWSKRKEVKPTFVLPALRTGGR
jgi:hypothetical protein